MKLQHVCAWKQLLVGQFGDLLWLLSFTKLSQTFQTSDQHSHLCKNFSHWPLWSKPRSPNNYESTVVHERRTRTICTDFQVENINLILSTHSLKCFRVRSRSNSRHNTKRSQWRGRKCASEAKEKPAGYLTLGRAIFVELPPWHSIRHRF